MDEPPAPILPAQELDNALAALGGLQLTHLKM